MIVYEVIDGLARNLRYEEDKYTLAAGELEIDGWKPLPTLESLSDPAKLQAIADAEAAELARRQALLEDSLALEMLEKLRSATPTQISDYVDNNVVALASARTMFKRVLLVMARIAS